MTSNMSKNIPKAGFSGIVLIISLFLACGTGHEASSDPQSPLYLGIAYDVSGSVNKQGFPALTSAHLDQLVTLFGKRGGVIGLGLIDEEAFEPLERLELKPVVGRLDERASQNRKNRKAIANFKMAVKHKIERPRNAVRTDLDGAMSRLALFFGEPTIPAGALKVALIVSDGVHTARGRKLSTRLPEDVVVLTVGIEQQLAEKLFGKQTQRFESVDAGIQYLKHVNN